MASQDSADQRRKVTVPLLWFQRVSYRAPSGETDRPSYYSLPGLGGRLAAAMAEPAAPLAWSLEACFLAIEAGVAAYVRRTESRWRKAAAVLIALAVQFARRVAERRRAHELGLDDATAPRLTTADVTRMAPMVIWIGGSRVCGWKSEERPWPRVLARSIIGAVDRRRAWNAALRGTGRGSASAASPPCRAPAGSARP